MLLGLSANYITIIATVNPTLVGNQVNKVLGSTPPCVIP